MELERDDAEGVVVLNVEPRSPAGRLGLRPGDKLIEANGVAIESTEIADRLTDAAIGGWRFAIERDGRTLRRSIR